MPHFRAHNWKIFPNLVLVRSLRGSFIDSVSSAKKRCNTSQGFGAFFGQSCDRDRFLFSFISEFLSFFSLFLDFIAISDCVFNNKNHYVLGHTGYQIIMTILVRSTLNANLHVATRVYDVEGGAIFSKNSTFAFFDGAAWTPLLRSPSPIMAPVITIIIKNNIIIIIRTFPACIAPEKFSMLNNFFNMWHLHLHDSYPSYRCQDDDVISHVTMAIKDVLAHCKNRLLSI